MAYLIYMALKNFLFNFDIIKSQRFFCMVTLKTFIKLTPTLKPGEYLKQILNKNYSDSVGMNELFVWSYGIQYFDDFDNRHFIITKLLSKYNVKSIIYALTYDLKSNDDLNDLIEKTNGMLITYILNNIFL